MNVEDYKNFEEVFNKMSVSDINKLNEFLLNHKEEFQTCPVETVRKGLEEVNKQLNFYNYVIDNIGKSSSPELIDYTKICNNQSRVEDGKTSYLDLATKSNVTDNIISDKKLSPIDIAFKLSDKIKREQHLEKITDPIKYEEIKHRQAEVEEEIKKTIEELPEEAKYSIGRLKEYRKMIKTQVNPKVFTDEVLIKAKYLQKLDQLLLSKISIQSSLAIESITLGHNLTSREQGYINYSNLLYYSKLEDLPLVYAMFYAEFSTEGFGEYAKQKLYEIKNEEKTPKILG